MRFLVTGGAGFLGSHLVDRLLSEGHEGIVLDDFSTGSWDNVSHLKDNPRVKCVEHDITEPYDGDVDRIYNLACPASPKHYQLNPVRTLLVSVLGVLRGLELAERTGARLLQASTSEIYGDPQAHPQAEEYFGNVDPTGPRACYDEGKRAAETLCFDYQRTARADVRVVRIFNTYGPRMAVDDGRVVSNFVVQALRGEALTIYGDGSHTRSFCYVDDLIDGMCRVMESNEKRVVNIGNPEECSVLALADIIGKQLGQSLAFVHRPLPEDDPKKRKPDISRAGALGFLPEISLDEGISKTLSYFRERLPHSGTDQKS